MSLRNPSASTVAPSGGAGKGTYKAAPGHVKESGKVIADNVTDWTPVVGEIKDAKGLSESVARDGWTPLNLFLAASFAVPYLGKVGRKGARLAKNASADRVDEVIQLANKRVDSKVTGMGNDIVSVKTVNADNGLFDVGIDYDQLPPNVLAKTSDHFEKLGRLRRDVVDASPVPLREPEIAKRVNEKLQLDPRFGDIYKKPKNWDDATPGAHPGYKTLTDDLSMTPHVLNKQGKFDLAKAKKDRGFGGIWGQELPQSVSISITSPIPGVLKGQGVGTDMYGHVLASAINKGKKMHSDASVSPFAQRVWQGMNRRGVAVEINPAAHRTRTGYLTTDGNGPVFVVHSDDPKRFLHTGPSLAQRTDGITGAGQKNPKWAVGKHADDFDNENPFGYASTDMAEDMMFKAPPKEAIKAGIGWGMGGAEAARSVEAAIAKLRGKR